MINRFIITLVMTLALCVPVDNVAQAKTPFDDGSVTVSNESNTANSVGNKTGTSASISASAPSTEGTSEEGTVVVNTSLNVRTSPWGDIVGSFKNGDKVTIIGEEGDWYKILHNGETRYIHSAYVKRKNGDDNKTINQVGYVNAGIGLNVRRVPNGDIIGGLPDKSKIAILGEAGDWYKIKWGNNEAFVSKNYIDSGKASAPVTRSAYSSATSAADGSMNQRIVKEAMNLLGSTNFRSAAVDYGNLACAQVVTTALKNAGAVNRVNVNVRSTLNDLRGLGWEEVNAPPYSEGDVITWKSSSGKADAHIGIIVKEGNTFKAMNNSSSSRTPLLRDPTFMTPCRVMRKT